MKIKLVSILIFGFISLSVFSQKNINDYKYVIVAKKFDFLKSENQYRVNELLEFLFNKHGFTAFIEGKAMPEDLVNNPCKAMYADLKDAGGFLTTKLQVEIKDCSKNLIVKSSIGKSKIKEYNKVYNVATRKAFESITFLNYKYNGKADDDNLESVEVTPKKDRVIENADEKVNDTNAEVERLKQEVEALKKQKADAEAKVEKERAEKEVALLEAKKANETLAKKVTYNAKITKNGYQLFNSISKQMDYELIKTAAPNVYTVKGKDAIVFKEGEKWMFSKNDTKRELKIQF